MNWISLYKKNSNYRHLLKANLISLFGDWFNFVAITAILFEISDNKSIIAYVFIVHLIPFFIFTPLAGVLADKFSRKKIMQNTDIIRFIIVLLYFPAIYIKSPELILFLLFIQFTFSSFFEPAKSAIIPDIVTKSELFSANASLSAVWSIMMSLGMSIGGIVVFITNAETALFIDAITYLLSYYFIKKINVKETHFNTELKFRFKDIIKIDDYLVTLHYLKAKSFMIPVVLSKGVLEIYTGAFIYFLTLYGELDFKVFGSAALSIGLLQAVRGIGTGVGPIVSRFLTKDLKNDYLILPFWLILIPLNYYFLSLQTTFGIALIFVFFAHMGGGANWVLSENIIHQIVPNKIRGRVISFEYLIFTFVMTISIKFGAIMIDNYELTLKLSTQYVAYIGILVSIIWLIFTFYIFKRKFPKSYL